MNSNNSIIVTKHPAIAEYIIMMGLAPKGTAWYPSVSPSFVKGKHVIGIIPLSLAAEAAQFTEVKVTLPPHQYGKELTLDAVCSVIKEVRTYRIEMIKDHLV